jgi:hypothetical protein
MSQQTSRSVLSRSQVLLVTLRFKQPTYHIVDVPLRTYSVQVPVCTVCVPFTTSPCTSTGTVHYCTCVPGTTNTVQYRRHTKEGHGHSSGAVLTTDSLVRKSQVLLERESLVPTLNAWTAVVRDARATRQREATVSIVTAREGIRKQFLFMKYGLSLDNQPAFTSKMPT